MDKRQLQRQIERTKKHIAEYEARKDSLSIHGYWSLGYYQGKLTAMEDVLDDIEEAELIATHEIAEKIFADIFVRGVGFDGHSIHITKNNLLEVAKNCGIEVE